MHEEIRKEIFHMEMSKGTNAFICLDTFSSTWVIQAVFIIIDKSGPVKLQ